MKGKLPILFFFLSSIAKGSFGQTPFVYNRENTGAGCTAPLLPSLERLPVIEPLPDPFLRADGRSRSTKFTDWECRRNEIKNEIENYEIGTKPGRPDTINATYADGLLTVNVVVKGQTLTITAQVVLPQGSGPFPAVIGMNRGSGALPPDIFSSRNIATITFSHNQVTTYNNPQPTDPYYRLYPELWGNSGQYSAWAWGVSRIIDGLELVRSKLRIDLKHLAVTGCSYAGKMALFAGALDERIALTIAQESGGGGATAWRVSETLGSVEKLGSTSHQWFRQSLFQFSGPNVSRLPYDHHELMAMVAPRALLVTGNTDYEWLSNPSCYITARATKKIYATLGIGDRFGFYIDGRHPHCAVPQSQRPAVEAFVDKFLLGKKSVNTDTVTINPYPHMDYERWYRWWGTGRPPVFPPEPPGIKIWMEAECATPGADWEVMADTLASNGRYIMAKSGLSSTAAAPGSPDATVVFPFTVDTSTSFNFIARVNCPTANNDSYWVKIDNGAFVAVNNLTTSGWQWVVLANSPLNAGKHTLTMAYREAGAKLDKVLVTTSGSSVYGVGMHGTNCGQLP